jgi:hypothetical protein
LSALKRGFIESYREIDAHLKAEPCGGRCADTQTELVH